MHRRTITGPLGFCLLSTSLATPGCKEHGDVGVADGSTTHGSARDEGTDETGDTDGVDDAADEPVVLGDAERLVRISMALRGRRPSPEQLDAVVADPAALPEIVDEYLASPELGEVIRDLHNDDLLLDVEFFELPAIAPLEDERPDALSLAAFSGPLRLAEHVVLEDRPYTELVTADYWMVDARTSAIWGSSYDEGGPQWQAVPIPDDRGAAGILADNGLFMRHRSDGYNFNRGRANVITRSLLCHDFLANDISVSGNIDLSDPDTVANAVGEVAECVSCHQTLDPIASALNGYLIEVEPEDLEQYPFEGFYQREVIDQWPEINNRSPGFYGQPIEDLEELGQAIADDPRFSLCTARRFYAYFMQIDREDVAVARVAQLQAVLVDSGFDAKALIREIVLSDDFRAIEGVDADGAELSRGYLRARPFQLANLVEQLTGYRWRLDLGVVDEAAAGHEIDLLTNGFIGFEVLAGGLDSYFITEAAGTTDVTSSLLLRRVALDAASYAVEQDLSLDADERRLLDRIEADQTDEDAVRRQLVALFYRLYAEQVDVDDEAITDAHAVFDAVVARTQDPALAWKTTLAALLQDLHIAHY